MQTEVEGKFLDVNVDGLRQMLRKNGATLVHPERLMRKNNFDYPDERLQKIGGWIRVRDEGDKIVLSYKQLIDRTINGTKEISLTVEGFDLITNFLLAIGLCKKSYQETKRERWEVDGVEVTIDTWPWIPTFVELEGQSENQLKTVADKLGLDWDGVMHGSVETAYQKYYNFSEEEIDNWEEITFMPAPDWLMVRKKN